MAMNRAEENGAEMNRDTMHGAEMNRAKSVGVLVAAAAVLALVFLPIVVESVRLLYLVALCLLLPGAGWAYRATNADVVDRIALAVVISMSATILVATAMVVTDSWSVAGGVAALAAVGLLGFVPGPRKRPADGGGDHTSKSAGTG